jgi:Trk K+ transport system NAD-binding subunit
MTVRTDHTPLLPRQRLVTSPDSAEEGHATYNQIMHRSTRRLIGLALGLVLFLIASALIYQEGMARLEGAHRTFWDSFEWAAETLSTTGYGYDSHWRHPAMVLLVVVVQFAGVFLVFLIVPIFLVPFLEERFERRVPRIAPKMANHVIVYRYGPTVETLLLRLKTHDIASIVVETDEATARAVQERDLSVVFSRAEEDALDVCRLEQARALVANGRDEENAALILRARQMGFRGEIFAFVEEPSHRKPMELAGATAAYTPRHIVAAALAAHASDRISPRLPGFEALPALERRELRVPATSPLAGLTLSSSNLGAATGAIVVGQWIRNRLHARCDASMIIEPGSILEIAGDAAALDRAAAMIGSRFLRRGGPFLIAGFGEVGRKVHELLSDAGEEVRVVEREARDGVDIVGNVLDPSVLERAALHECRAIVLALNSDDATLFATVIARDAAADVPVIARVNHSRNIDNIYRAGADFALSISDISGEMLSARLLGRVARSRDEHRQVVRVIARSPQSLRDLPLRTNGCSLLAIKRSHTYLPITAETSLKPGDELYICGTAEAVKVVAELLLSGLAVS